MRQLDEDGLDDLVLKGLGRPVVRGGHKPLGRRMVVRTAGVSAVRPPAFARLHRSQWIEELGRLAALNADITHALLDEQPPSSRIVHLRAVLSYAGVIPQREEYIESSVAWLDRFLAKQPEEIAAVLRPYATWSVLRRARHRARRRDPSRSVTKYNRNLVTLAAQLMRWLSTESISLSDLAQADLDRWLALGKLNRQRVRDFLRWTHARGMTRKLTVPVGGRTQPHEFLNDDHRWQVLRRCASDSTIDVDVRAAAALVVLFGLTQRESPS